MQKRDECFCRRPRWRACRRAALREMPKVAEGPLLRSTVLLLVSAVALAITVDAGSANCLASRPPAATTSVAQDGAQRRRQNRPSTRCRTSQ